MCDLCWNFRGANICFEILFQTDRKQSNCKISDGSNIYPESTSDRDSAWIKTNPNVSDFQLWNVGKLVVLGKIISIMQTKYKELVQSLVVFSSRVCSHSSNYNHVVLSKWSKWDPITTSHSLVVQYYIICLMWKSDKRKEPPGAVTLNSLIFSDCKAEPSYHISKMREYILFHISHDNFLLYSKNCLYHY